jgi:hypothetical protein
VISFSFSIFSTVYIIYAICMYMPSYKDIHKSLQTHSKRQVVSKICCRAVYLNYLWNGIFLSSRQTSLNLFSISSWLSRLSQGRLKKYVLNLLGDLSLIWGGGRTTLPLRKLTFLSDKNIHQDALKTFFFNQNNIAILSPLLWVF